MNRKIVSMSLVLSFATLSATTLNASSAGETCRGAALAYGIGCGAACTGFIHPAAILICQTACAIEVSLLYNICPE